MPQVEQELRDMIVEAQLPMLCAVGWRRFERKCGLGALCRCVGFPARQKSHGVRMQQSVEKTLVQGFII
ncbi:hypothetical protein AQ733_17815 [Burkholderia pseudomallei]|nr:hypothetical protein AQ733_17815 [Burkholderia pseudomallei]OMS16423.1 hypothetical protein AQ735_27410 [Burkholderia pseudomallei]